MAKVDDLLEKRAKQVVLAIVARLAHRSPPTANLAVEGITDHPNRESQTARKPTRIPGFLAKSITCSGQIIAIDQSLPNSSRTTKECRDAFVLLRYAYEDPDKCLFYMGELAYILRGAILEFKPEWDPPIQPTSQAQ